MCRFVKLPTWIKVMLTCRPEIVFNLPTWKANTILLDNRQQYIDLSEWLQWRLAAYVVAADVHAAAGIILNKCQVR